MGFIPPNSLKERGRKWLYQCPCTTFFVDSMQSNGQAYTNISDESELHDQTFFNQDELMLYHMIFGDAQTNEAESIGSNRQA